ncbi:MAG: Gfo/Idh/MocA family oxidoreductase [Prevotellaceae bacterium]|jgi:predicted dehydrogenase|nr:Gfo/Idh/MocA family oxidoreductase [Prevotellaceae bacterium]
MECSKTYNWGIVGAGRISRKFVDGLKATRNGRPYAVAARNIDDSQEFAREKDMPVAYGSYAELAADPQVDAVYIGTVNTMHEANTILMLSHKKPVLCEKPFAMNRVEVDRMIAAARRNKTFLMEALWTNFLPSMNAVRKIIDGGVIGDITYIRADLGFFRAYDPQIRTFNPEVGGSSLLDIGIYPVFLAVTLLGYPDHITAQAVRMPDGVDVTSSMFFKWKNGAVAQLFSSYCIQLDCEGVIYGSKGKITMHRRFHAPTSISVTVDGNTQDYPVTSVGNGYNYEAQEVMDCLDKGLLESPLFPLAESARFISLLDAIIQQFS